MKSGKAQKGKSKREGKHKKGNVRVHANPETYLRVGRSSQNVICASCGTPGHLRAVCLNPTAHEVSHSPAPEAVVEEDGVWL